MHKGLLCKGQSGYTSSMASPKLRRGVCGIFISPTGKILLGERAKEKGEWQLPQGGIEGDETPLEALAREMEEEVGVKKIKVLRDTGHFIPYLWPPGLFKSKFAGQEHIYFVLDGAKIDLKKLRPTEEFRDFAWFTPEQALKEIVDWKKAVNAEAFRLLELTGPQ
jgi:putative (di)nucleoside polyphosphate hydrolase